jgi:protease-4
MLLPGPGVSINVRPVDSNLPPENPGLPDASAPPPAAAPPSQPPPPAVPPPLNRPPPIIAPTQRPRKSGSGWKVAAIIFLVLLGLSMVFNVHQAVTRVVNLRSGTTHEAGPKLEEAVLRDVDADKKIAVIDVDGIITSDVSDQDGGYSMVTLIKEQLRMARKDADVRAVILRVDSPGGEVLAADEISSAIRDFQAKSAKPVIVSMGSLAASGGYYVSAPCEWIVANELTITGSIGVIMDGYNYRGLMDKVGVLPEVYKSGKFKDMLSPTRETNEISPEEVEMVQKLINETFDKFKTTVAEGRHASYQLNKKQGQALSSDWEDYADGRVLSGKDAYRLGFVDEIGDFDTAVQTAENLAHVSSANLIEYQPSFDISNILRLFGRSSVQPVKVDFGIEIPRLRPGCMYFLSPTYVR